MSDDNPILVTTAAALAEPALSLAEARQCLRWKQTAVTVSNISYLLRALRTALDAASVVGACGIESRPHALNQDACVGWEPEPSFDPDGMSMAAPTPAERKP